MEKFSFKNQLENLVRNPENHRYLLAVSGGADSMVLASLFQGLGLTYQIAHINYKLRGEDSDLDQKTVQDFCEKNHIPFHLYEVSENDKKPENSIQLWARELRYRFFREIQDQEKLEFLVTAHHLNDQLETFIINLSKASGINGLSGIPAGSNKTLRPLLSFSKKEIYEYAEENHIDFREDLSNKKSDYLRNKIRNEIVPKLLETNDHFLENFKKSSSYLNQTREFVSQQIDAIEHQLTIPNNDYIILSRDRLSLESDFVKFEILKKYGFDREEEIPKIFISENGSTFFSKKFQLIIGRNELIFTDKNAEVITRDEILVMENFDDSQNSVSINLADMVEKNLVVPTNFEWSLDAATLQFPLHLRKLRNGDIFYPLGFSGKKKVSKFLRDEKLSVTIRTKTWILSDGNNAVVGILPFRQDKRFVASKETKLLLRIYFKDQEFQ